MSYEGYEQLICDKGHYYVASCWDEKPKCLDCGSAVIAWHNSVDDTNCDDWGIIPEEQIEALVIEPAVYETCNLEHPHLISPAVYRIPREGELQRYFRRVSTGKLEPTNTDL